MLFQNKSGYNSFKAGKCKTKEGKMTRTSQ